MESKINRALTAVLVLFSLGSGFLQSGLDGKNGPVVRVAVLNGVDKFDLSIRGRYSLMDSSDQTELAKDKRLLRTTVYASGGAIYIDGTSYSVRRLRIIAHKDAALYKKDRAYRYRGELDIIHKKDGTFLVINCIVLEDYVKGVLYHEVPHYWPIGAIKAQAVATRTYALHRIQERKDELYDVTSDIYSQVYGGRSAERYRTRLAADRTRGEILTYKGKVLPAFFHSTCGGKTENVNELWKYDFPPLFGVEDHFCETSPHYRWKKNFRSKTIQEQLNKHGYKLGLIKEIKPVERTGSGRVKTLKITMRDGTIQNIPGLRFREIIGPNTLKSNFYDIEMKGYYFDVIGRGWGHGVGMCQWGAYEMAKQRYKYTSILDHYYPGAQVTQLQDL